MEDRLLELGTAQPVGGAEGLLAEATPAVTAAEPLDAAGRGQALEKAVADEAPTARLTMEWAAGIGAKRRCRCGHASESGKSSASTIPPSTTYFTPSMTRSTSSFFLAISFFEGGAGRSPVRASRG